MIFAIIVAIWNHNKFDDFLVSRLFKIKTEVPAGQAGPSKPCLQADFIQEETLPSLGDYLLSWVPEICQCCPKNRRKRALEKARARLEAEVNIVEMIKTHRYVALALRHLLPKHVRSTLKARTRYITIDPDLPEDDRAEDFAAPADGVVEHELTEGFFSSEDEDPKEAALAVNADGDVEHGLTVYNTVGDDSTRQLQVPTPSMKESICGNKIAP